MTLSVNSVQEHYAYIVIYEQTTPQKHVQLRHLLNADSCSDVLVKLDNVVF